MLLVGALDELCILSAEIPWLNLLTRIINDPEDISVFSIPLRVRRMKDFAKTIISKAALTHFTTLRKRGE